MLETANVEIGPEWMGPIEPFGPQQGHKPVYLQCATEGATLWFVDAPALPDDSFVGYMVADGDGIVDVGRFVTMDATPLTHFYMRSSAQPGKTCTAVIGCFTYE